MGDAFDRVRVMENYIAHKPLFYAALRPAEAELIACELPTLEGPRLDFGCGDGFFASQLAPAGFFDYGVDMDPRLAATCAKVYGRYIAWDNARLPFEDASIGAIVCNSVMEHTRNPRLILDEWRRILRPGGRVVCTITLKAWDEAMPRLLRPALRRIQRHHTLWTAEAWGEAFAQAGLRIERTEGYASAADARRILTQHVSAAPRWGLSRMGRKPDVQWVRESAFVRTVDLEMEIGTSTCALIIAVMDGY